MKILLTFPPPTNNLVNYAGINRQTSTAIYLLGEILKDEGFQVKVFDPVSYFNDDYEFMSDKFIGSIISDVDMVAISANSFNWSTAKILTNEIKKICRNMPIILGGVHPTMMDEYVLQTTNADVVARKEGEKILPNLIRAIISHGVNNLYQVKGISFKNNFGEIIKNVDDKPLSELEYNNVILPQYNEMPQGFYVGIPCETSRGCLYNCAFCGVMHHNTWKCMNSKNTENQIDNAIYWAKKRCVSPIIFMGDDCISVNKNRLTDIFKYIGDRKDEFQVFMEGRLGDIDNIELNEFFPSEKVMRFLVGIESGYDEGLKLVRKGYKVDEIRYKLSKFKGKKFLDSIFCTFIIGLPWEDYSCCLKTIQFAVSLYRDFGIKSNIGWWSLIPSYLWDIRKKYNINVGPDIYEKSEWYALNYQDRNSIFSKTHPQLSSKNIEKLIHLINIYSKSGIKIMDD